MPFCSSCGNPLNQNDRFCNNCGAAISGKNETVIPTATIAAEPAPYVYSAPVCSGKSKALGFVGMGLAIAGLVFAVLGLLYTFLGMMAGDGVGLGMSIGFGIFSLPLSIVGGSLCDRSIHMGNFSAACSVGSKIRIAGVIVSAVMLFFGIVSLAA